MVDAANRHNNQNNWQLVIGFTGTHLMAAFMWEHP